LNFASLKKIGVPSWAEAKAAREKGIIAKIYMMG
jgi:hypothetical protein